MTEVGQSAPDFTLIDQDREEVVLSHYRGRKNVLLSFHIYSFTGD